MQAFVQKQDLGRRFGHDFRTVRTHIDDAAAAAARALQAHAYTVGRDIVFGGGAWSTSIQHQRGLGAPSVRQEQTWQFFLTSEFGSEPTRRGLGLPIGQADTSRSSGTIRTRRSPSASDSDFVNTIGHLLSRPNPLHPRP